MVMVKKITHARARKPLCLAKSDGSFNREANQTKKRKKFKRRERSKAAN